jgi:hypothetical protein
MRIVQTSAMSVHCVYGALNCFTIATRQSNARKAGTCSSVQQIVGCCYGKKISNVWSHIGIRHWRLTASWRLKYELKKLHWKQNQMLFLCYCIRWPDLATPRSMICILISYFYSPSWWFSETFGSLWNRFVSAVSRPFCTKTSLM